MLGLGPVGAIVGLAAGELLEAVATPVLGSSVWGGDKPPVVVGEAGAGASVRAECQSEHSDDVAGRDEC